MPASDGLDGQPILHAPPNGTNERWCRVWDGGELICDRERGHPDDQADGLHHRARGLINGTGPVREVWWTPGRSDQRTVDADAGKKITVQDGVALFEATVKIPRDMGSYDAADMAVSALHAKVREAGRYAFADSTYDLRLGPDLAGDEIELTASARVISLDKAMGAWDGPVGPYGPQHRSTPHVYAREIHSGAGNCCCGAALGDPIHTEAAAGVPIPEGLRIRRG